MSEVSSVTAGDGVTAADGYAGDMSVGDAWALLASDPNAVLIDVRTGAEWAYVGLPELSSLNKQVMTVEWVSWPGAMRNEGFASEIQALGILKDAVLLMLCRSGVRSIAAAKLLTEAGYERCYNILGGFEGDMNDDKHRGHTGGWKVAGLPWVQK